MRRLTSQGQLHRSGLAPPTPGGIVEMKKIADWLGANFEQIFLVFTALMGVSFLAAGHLKLIQFEAHMADVIVALLSLIAICLFLQRVDEKKAASDLDTKLSSLNGVLNNQFSTVIGSLRGLEYYKSFSGGPEFVGYLADRILQAKRSVDDLTWLEEPRADRYAKDRVDADQRYYSAMASAAERGVTYKEIFVFTEKEKVEKMRTMVEKNIKYYSCGYFEGSDIPRPVFIIIDDEEVLVYGMDPRVFCAFKHPELVPAFNEYYTQLWRKCTKIKDGNDVNKTIYQTVSKKFETSGS